MSKKVIIKVDYNGVSVAFEGKEMVNLTDLWRAAGSPELKDPNVRPFIVKHSRQSDQQHIQPKGGGVDPVRL